LATARNSELLGQIEQKGKLETLRADVTSAEDRGRMIEAMRSRFGGLDVLVNNAGIGATGHFAEASEERLRTIFEVNFFAMAELTRLAVPLLKEGRTPAVVNISSVIGRRAIPGRSEYSASKYAVQGLSEALRGEFSLFGIDVLLVNPGLTATNFSANMLERKSKLQVDHMRGMSADQAAAATLRAIARGKNEVTFTGAGKLLIAVNRFFPRLVDRIIARRVRRLYHQSPH
jgi:short-subunit dehydrogenase